MEADTWLVRPSWFSHRPDPNSSSSGSKVPPPEAPLFDTTLSNGGTEEEPQLYVGHTPIDLRKDRTLKAVYLDRIWEILERVNPDQGRYEEANENKEGKKEGKKEEKEEGKTGGKNKEGKGNKQGVVGEKGWDWNGVYTDRGAKDQTLLFYIDVVSRLTLSSLVLDFQMKTGKADCETRRLSSLEETQPRRCRDHVALPRQSARTLPTKRIPHHLYPRFPQLPDHPGENVHRTVDDYRDG